MISETMVDKYLGYLTDRFEIPDTYTMLCCSLLKKPFVPVIKDDYNRVEDALTLRIDFVECYSDIYDDIVPIDEYGNFEEEDVSCLEMLLYLALRLEEDLMYDYKEGDRTIEWFFEFITNLNLDDITNENYSEKSCYYISEILDRWMNREYNDNGENGNIIITNRNCDMRNMPIWNQLQEFSREAL